ncbi:MAG: hypothetical protein AAGK02_04815 [Pseudomonadota bacterium]
MKAESEKRAVWRKPEVIAVAPLRTTKGGFAVNPAQAEDAFYTPS